jgi:hypothetical protein
VKSTLLSVDVAVPEQSDSISVTRIPFFCVLSNNAASVFDPK